MKRTQLLGLTYRQYNIYNVNRPSMHAGCFITLIPNHLYEELKCSVSFILGFCTTFGSLLKNVLALYFFRFAVVFYFNTGKTFSIGRTFSRTIILFSENS